MVNTIGKISGAGSNIDDKGLKHYEKTIKDINDVDESLDKARDLGFTSVNDEKLTSINQLSKYDTVDYFKFSTKTNGKMTLAVMDGEDDGKGPLDLSEHYDALGLDNPEDEDNYSSNGPLDLNKYDDMLNELLKMNDPSAYSKKMAKEADEALEKSKYTNAHPSLQVEVIQIINGKEVVVADSHAEIGSDELETYNNMMNGEYEAEAGEEFFMKITKDESVSDSEDVEYSFEVSQGTESDRNYLTTEKASDDVKNQTKTLLTSEMIETLYGSSGGTTSGATATSGAADMLLTGAISYSYYTSK